ncbi:Succinate dehydrogenase assembly factor 1, mitochondrial [Schizosaccharomyces pombe]|uniref:Succinate dehydrogenase assembly factor 1, mitochondrial n=1 Tax=Schizosaccharomyces pombe (strain 972 / ATCC 24843) TaxID=284812 RepID=SDHF1_SCHPO|nr:putative succinate dehydrogenase assembly factor 1 [Schizosaccharomyces pombe]Q9US02.1 RecName: Full=Succinate dehydrogenase assembly factor 1, mitochondrial; Short=SDH assembly factor 1; Short=SDHAF1 [Schizosaccharomyces pombe 972h-]CAB65813.1 mitochondrial succinate dehydrogenase assembly factor 1 (predicted) [Schizosaccharomyces pombe]|eukprot:NP_593460.1 putative succinate dehydrogenase assembly factor 1 [Schizosaccharomyces pombe]
MALSGLQRQVIHFYRRCLHAAKAKEQPYNERWMAFVHQEFRKNQTISKRDFFYIEHLLRVGQRQYEAYSRPEVKDIHFS